jgi:SAM-dependent methyltransferase
MRARWTGSAQNFDFILFSFNGIDYVPACDRNAVFRELRRVGSKGGLFFFSTHNLQCLRTFGDKFKSRPDVVINDGVHVGRLHTYCTGLRRSCGDCAAISRTLSSMA